MSKGLFITGTGTDIGKTYITGLLCKKLNEANKSIAYYKAAMSGNERDSNGNIIRGDSSSVINISGIHQDIETTCPYVYEIAVSPHLAAKVENNTVDMNVVMDGYEKVKANYDYVIAEGSGGILCPIRFDEEQIWLEDIIRAMNIPCLMIADAGLGTINSVVLTYEYMKKKNIECKGIIFNNYHPGDLCEEDNKKMCEYLTGLKVLTCVKQGDTDIDIDADTLTNLFA